MNILFSSYAFAPGIGGIETVSAILAAEFAGAGHQVELITETPGKPPADAPFGLTRQPLLRKTLELLRWADVFLQNNISLQSLVPALCVRKPAVVVHQTWIRNPRGHVGWNGFLKRRLLRAVENVAISQALADDLHVRCTIIPNPYCDDIFKILPSVPRDRSLIFCGRLVSDKGVDLLLEALQLLRDEGLAPDLTIVGSGSEESNLREQSLGLDLQVSFLGVKSGSALAEILNRHRIMVVPSRWAEPFGVVALEGLACGCVVVGSEEGGLKEAIGDAGVTFANGDVRALADALKNLLLDRPREANLRAAAPAHLRQFTAAKVAERYCALLERVAR